ncbi:MAG TPA: hypothetical protein VF690_11955 [Hymenobacter sp.]
MKHFLSFLLLAGALAACSPEAVRVRQWKRYLKDVRRQPPVPPDTATGAYAPNEEIEVLDQLLRKYPGRQTVRTVTKVETKVLPGKTVYVEVPVRADTARNITERDSLLGSLERLVGRERADSELRAEIARLRANLLRAFNNRACLPDTVVRFAKYDLVLDIKRGAGERYGFTWREGPRTFTYDATVTEEKNSRVIVPDRVLWRDRWFWAVVALSSLSLWLLYLRLRDANPTNR